MKKEISSNNIIQKLRNLNSKLSKGAKEELEDIGSLMKKIW